MSGSEDGTSRLGTELETSVSLNGDSGGGLTFEVMEPTGGDDRWLISAEFTAFEPFSDWDYLAFDLAAMRRLRDWLNSLPLGGE